MYFNSSIILPVLHRIVKGFFKNDAKCLLYVFPPFRRRVFLQTRSMRIVDYALPRIGKTLSRKTYGLI